MSTFSSLALRYLRDGLPPDLTLRQLAIFWLVCLRPGRSTGEIAGKLGTSKPVVTRAVRTLALLGLVEQTTDQGDRRKRHINLTARGREFDRQLQVITFPAGDA